MARLKLNKFLCIGISLSNIMLYAHKISHTVNKTKMVTANYSLGFKKITGAHVSLAETPVFVNLFSSLLIPLKRKHSLAPRHGNLLLMAWQDSKTLAPKRGLPFLLTDAQSSDALTAFCYDHKLLFLIAFIALNKCEARPCWAGLTVNFGGQRLLSVLSKSLYAIGTE